MRLSLFLLICVQYLIVNASSASQQKDCVTDCGTKKCESDKFCRVKYRQLCSDDPDEPEYDCVTAEYATYNVAFSIKKVRTWPGLHSYFYRTDTFSDCKKGHARKLTWKWPAQLVKHSWTVPYLYLFLQHYEYEGTDNEMYSWKGCQCGMHACPESFELSTRMYVDLGLDIKGSVGHFDHEFSYQFSCRKECDPLTIKAVEANFTKTKNGTQDSKGNPFLLPTKELCTNNASSPLTTRRKLPEAQIYQTCPGSKKESTLLVILLVAGAVLLLLSLLLAIGCSLQGRHKSGSNHQRHRTLEGDH